MKKKQQQKNQKNKNKNNEMRREAADDIYQFNTNIIPAWPWLQNDILDIHLPVAKTSSSKKNNYKRNCHQNSLLQPSKTDQLNQPVGSLFLASKDHQDQDFLMIPGGTKVNQFAQVGSKFWQQFLSIFNFCLQYIVFF